MSIQEGLRQLVGGRFVLSRGRAATGGWWGPEPPGNDATAYGVEIEEADVEGGQPYWRAVRVHHLTPEENGGKHHIFLDVLDEAGERLFGAQLRVTWDGQEQVIIAEERLNEPGANFPTFGGQRCAVEVLGLPDQTLPSDLVLNLHADHLDEPPGNTRFHHSFSVVFQRTTNEDWEPRESVLEGTVRNGAGRTVVLLLNGEPVVGRTVGEDGRYSFSGLWAGTYVVAVLGTSARSAPISLDGHNAATVNLEAPAEGPEKSLAEYVLFGPPDAPGTQTSLLLAVDYLLEKQTTFGFRAEEARVAHRVLIIGDAEAVSGEVEAELTAAGCEVERVAGDSCTVERLLAQRIG